MAFEVREETRFEILIILGLLFPIYLNYNPFPVRLTFITSALP
jgi:hypothetical protein